MVKKHLKVFFSRTKKALRLNIGSYDGHSLTFDLFTAKSNLHPHTFVWGNVEKSLFQYVYLQCMVKVVKLFGYRQRFGVICTCLWAIYMFNI